MDGDDDKNKDESLEKKIQKRTDNSEAIIDFFKGLSVQECIDTLDSVKRKILSRAKI